MEDLEGVLRDFLGGTIVDGKDVDKGVARLFV